MLANSLISSQYKIMLDSSWNIFSSNIYIGFLLFIVVRMGYVIFDEGCLWCRSLASFIYRVFNIETIPLRRAAENIGIRLSRGRVYVVDSEVREGLKPLIKLI